MNNRTKIRVFTIIGIVLIVSGLLLLFLDSVIDILT